MGNKKSDVTSGSYLIRFVFILSIERKIIIQRVMIEQERRNNNQLIQLKVKTMNGMLYFVQLQYNGTVASLQAQIEEKTGVPIDSQRLLHKAVLLQCNRLISDYAINDGDTIQLVANMLPEESSSPSISTHRQSEVARTHALTQQNLRSKKHRYLQQRINGFSIQTQSSIQALKQNKAVIDQLITCLNQNKQELIQPFLLKSRQLYVGDWVDVRDVSGLWVEGQVIAKKHNYVEIHCNGYPDRWNQWIDQSSDRIMPLRTQTVQTEETAYLSPFPVNKPQIKSIRSPENTLQKLLAQLPETLNTISTLFQQMEKNSKAKLTNRPKYSFNQYEQQQDQIAESFKNNRSHNSPPQSIHEQEYEYEYENDEVEMVNMPLKVNEKKQGQGGSIKGKIVLKNGRKFMRSNRYIDTKKAYLGYSKTKSEHEHTLNHRQQTPNKNGSIMVGENERVVNGVIVRQKNQKNEQQEQKNIKYEEMDIQDEVETPKTETQVQLSNPFSETIIPSNANKQADNMSNKCEQNMSNKGDHDDGESSAKSFGSKRSDRFPDASSMKSLNIDTLHNDQSKKDDKNAHGKKNIFYFDHSEAQSVREAAQNQDAQTRSNYYYNQQGILEEEDSQINEQINEQYYMEKKKQAMKKLRATQLAPLCDRLGRMLVDLAPHLATMGYKQFNSSPQFSENLSTFTNEGSLQSRLKNFNMVEEEQSQKSSHQSNKYFNFQIPVMLTPWQIMKINKFLSEEGRPDTE